MSGHNEITYQEKFEDTAKNRSKVASIKEFILTTVSHDRLSELNSYCFGRSVSKLVSVLRTIDKDAVDKETPVLNSLSKRHTTFMTVDQMVALLMLMSPHMDLSHGTLFEVFETSGNTEAISFLFDTGMKYLQNPRVHPHYVSPVALDIGEIEGRMNGNQRIKNTEIAMISEEVINVLTRDDLDSFAASALHRNISKTMHFFNGLCNGSYPAFFSAWMKRHHKRMTIEFVVTGDDLHSIFRELKLVSKNHRHLEYGHLYAWVFDQSDMFPNETSSWLEVRGKRYLFERNISPIASIQIGEKADESIMIGKEHEKPKLRPEVASLQDKLQKDLVYIFECIGKSKQKNIMDKFPSGFSIYEVFRN